MLASGSNLVYVRVPAAEWASWRDADGVPGRRFTDTLAERGQVWTDGELAPELKTALAAAARAVGPDLVVDDAEPLVEPGALLYLGPADGGFFARSLAVATTESAGSGASTLPARTRTWLDRSDRLRWEEVVEILDLNDSENAAFRALGGWGAAHVTGPVEGMRSLRRAFLRDKRIANCAIFLLGAAEPSVTAFRLDLGAAFHDSLLVALDRATPAPQDEDAGRFFEARVRGSVGRVYGRLDRIAQSILLESPSDTRLVIDASGGPGGFLAILTSNRGATTTTPAQEELARTLRAAFD